MGAASSGGAICGKCGEMHRRYQQMKGGAPICKECAKVENGANNAKLRREIHELKAEIARMKRDGYVDGKSATIRGPRPAITPPEQRWDGYTH